MTGLLALLVVVPARVVEVVRVKERVVRRRARFMFESQLGGVSLGLVWDWIGIWNMIKGFVWFMG